MTDRTARADELTRLENENRVLKLELETKHKAEDRARRLREAQIENANLKRWLAEAP